MRKLCRQRQWTQCNLSNKKPKFTVSRDNQPQPKPDIWLDWSLTSCWLNKRCSHLDITSEFHSNLTHPIFLIKHQLSLTQWVDENFFATDWGCFSRSQPYGRNQFWNNHRSLPRFRQSALYLHPVNQRFDWARNIYCSILSIATHNCLRNLFFPAGANRNANWPYPNQAAWKKCSPEKFGWTLVFITYRVWTSGCFRKQNSNNGHYCLW